MSQTYLNRTADPDNRADNLYTTDDGQVVGKVRYILDAGPLNPAFQLVRMGLALDAMIPNPGLFHTLEAAEYSLLASVAEARAIRQIKARTEAAATDVTV